MVWDELEKLIKQGLGGEKEEVDEAEEAEQETKKAMALVKKTALSEKIKNLFKESGIDFDENNLLNSVKDIDELIERAKSNHKLRKAEEKKERDKNREPNEWEEFAKKISKEGEEDFEEGEEEALKGKPKGFSITMIAIGKPKKKFMESSDTISKSPEGFKSTSDLEEEDED